MTDEGSLVLVFDDGYREDHEEVRPVLQSAGVPAVFAVVPTWLGEPGHLDAGELEELTAIGCEVAAHGRRHRYLQSHGLARDADAGDQRIVLDSEHVFPNEDHGVYPGDRYEVVDVTGTEAVELAGKGTVDGRPAVDLAAPLGRGFAAGETVFRPTESLLRGEIVGASELLRDAGFDPRTFVFPYDAADGRAWSVAAEHYDVIANVGVRSLPNPPGTETTNLRRWYLETSHLALPGLDDYLDAVAGGGGLGVLAGHSAWNTVTPERIETVVAAARERDVEVTTFERS